MKMNEKEMNLDEMEIVNGATVNEFSELQQAMLNNPALRKLAGFGSHVPLSNMGGRDAVKNILRAHGIDADISLGFLGTGIGSSANRYINRHTNEEISHQEVLRILQNQ